MSYLIDLARVSADLDTLDVDGARTLLDDELRRLLSEIVGKDVRNHRLLKHLPRPRAV